MSKNKIRNCTNNNNQLGSFLSLKKLTFIFSPTLSIFSKQKAEKNIIINNAVKAQNKCER